MNGKYMYHRCGELLDSPGRQKITGLRLNVSANDQAR